MELAVVLPVVDFEVVFVPVELVFRDFEEVYSPLQVDHVAVVDPQCFQNSAVV